MAGSVREIERLGQSLAQSVEARRTDLVTAGVARLRFPHRDVHREVERTIECLDRLVEIRPWIDGRMPLAGPGQSVAVMLPYNLVSQGIFFIATLLAAGNEVTVRFSSQGGPLVEICEAVLKEGAEDRVHVTTTSGAEFVDHVRTRSDLFPALIAYGGERLGGLLSEYSISQKTIFEGPGKDPLIVLAGSDPTSVANVLRGSKFSRSGQECIASERVVIVDSVYDDTLASIIDLCQNARFGDPEDLETEVGPLQNTYLSERIKEQLTEATSKGGRVVVGGKIREDFVAPTIVLDTPSDSALWNEETFGPVIAVRRVPDEKEAIRVAIAGKYGLHAIVTGDNATDVADRLSGPATAVPVEKTTYGRVGTVTIERAMFTETSDDFEPFGGWGISGWIRELDGRLRQGPRVLAREVSIEPG